MKPTTYFFFDIDGTLLCHGKTFDERCHPKTIEGLKRVREAGHRIFLNTARAFSNLPSDLLEHVTFDGYICGLGADIRVGDVFVRHDAIPKEALEACLDYFVAQDIAFHLEGETSLYRSRDFSIDRIREAIKQERFSKIAFPYKIDEAGTAFLEQWFDVYHHPTYSEVGQKGHNKATGILDLLKFYHATVTDAVAVGDSVNDRDMFRVAKTSVAMGNAPEDIKAMCDIVTTTVKEGGVGDYLMCFLST